MKIGILSKRTGNFTGKIKLYLEKKGHTVNIYTANNLCINDSLLVNDFFILKSKHLFYLYAGYFLEANNVPVIPSTDISYRHKNRIESYFSIKNTNLLLPNVFMGTIDTLKSQLKKTNLPLISKPILGSGSKGVKVINSFQDFNTIGEESFYLEKFIEGTHYLVYFIDKEICICEKKPLANEHDKVKVIHSDGEIEEYIRKWKNKYNLLFGHLDLVRDKNTNKLFVVDAGTFPEFSNWKHNTDPVSKVCNLILDRYQQIKNKTE